jgi:hypothetical protein
VAATCPKCGGSEVRQLTPNYYECLGQVLIGVAPPEVTGVPHPVPHYRPCGARFQVGEPASTQKCYACGLDSIGACENCERRLCGRHGASTGAFLCRGCFDRRAADEEKARAAASRDKKSAEQKLRTDASAILAQSDDLTEIAAAIRRNERYIEVGDCREAWKRLVKTFELEPEYDCIEIEGRGSLFYPWHEVSQSRVVVWRAEGVGRILNHVDRPGKSDIDVFLAADGRHWRSSGGEVLLMQQQYTSWRERLILPRGASFRTKRREHRRFVPSGRQIIRAGNSSGEEAPTDYPRAVAEILDKAASGKP